MELLRKPEKLAAACHKFKIPTHFTATINGRNVNGELSSFDVKNPANGVVFAESPSCSESQLNEAATAAKNQIHAPPNQQPRKQTRKR